MKILSLGLTGAYDEFRSKLQDDCYALVEEGFRIAIDETNKGSYTFIGCNIAEGELSFRNYERVKNMLKGYVSQLLADKIINSEEKFLLRKIITNNYRYFNEEERKKILDNALKLLNEHSGLFEDFSYAARHNQVLTKIQEYLVNHHELVLEGFVAFRLKDYHGKLVAVVDKAVDEYMMDIEYKEFIQVLRYFVDIQEVQVEEVHVIVDIEGCFTIRDSAGKILNHQYLEAFIMKNGEEISFEDILISALITIAPHYVVIHYSGANGENFASTIKSVFEGRVILCHGCDMCKEYLTGQFDGRN
ncbi:MAG: Sporulation protein YtxC [Firmicutes bacterium]|nr:Sporulation protein YtxC [Bacillota bacterium]